MSDAKYEEIQNDGYAMLKLRNPPQPFTDVHLTISSDTATHDGKRFTKESIWRLPHFTFVEPAGVNADKKVHVFVIGNGKYAKLVDSDKNAFGNKKYTDLCWEMLGDPRIDDALFEGTEFVKYP